MESILANREGFAMVDLPEWVWEFHGHHCLVMPMGYRMGLIGLRELGMEKVKDHGAFALPEIGVGHPQTCVADGIQAATGCTYGKMMMESTNFGKIAYTLYEPSKGAVRVAARAEFLGELRKFAFFDFRMKGVKPSEIPLDVTQPAIEFVLSVPEEKAFKIEKLGNFGFSRAKGSFVKDVCDNCGEVVFERYLRIKDGRTLCLPCSAYDRE